VTAPSITIRRATPADLPAVGWLGALLVRQHHAFDAARFMAAPPRTEALYAAFLGDELQRPAIVVLNLAVRRRLTAVRSGRS
jgi:hypothetical protein